MPRTRRYTTRLSRRQRMHNLRAAIAISLVTSLILGAMVYWGLPLFIKFTNWWLDRQFAQQSEAETSLVIPPPPPRLIVPQRTVNQANLTVNGFSEPNATVVIYLNQTPMEQVLVDDKGQFTVNLTLEEGTNQIYAITLDDQNAQSDPSNPVVVVYDSQAPELTIESPADGSEFFGKKQQTVEIKGQVVDASRLLINNRMTVLGTDGRFVSQVKLSQGENNIEIKAIDQAGNETAVKLKLFYFP